MSPYFIQSGQKSKCLHFLKLAVVSHSQERCWIQQKCLHWLSKFLSLWWSYCHWIFFIFPKKLYYLNWCPPTPIPLKAWKTTGQNLKIEIDSWSLNINRYIKSLNLHLMISYIRVQYYLWNGDFSLKCDAFQILVLVFMNADF